MELKLMNFLGKFTTSVEVEENDVIVISVITGDWVMEKPYEVDSDNNGRFMDFYDGRVTLLATKENIDRINAMKKPYELLEVFGEDEINEGWA